MRFSSSVIKNIFSYLVPQVIEVVESPLSGELEIAIENGRLVMNTKHSNYSYGSLQKVFEFAFLKASPTWESISSVLILGMGGGCLVDVLKAQSGFNATITAVESDAAVIELGRRHFSGQYQQVDLVKADALEYIDKTTLQFDLVLVDLFIDNELAPGCVEPEFIERLWEVVNPAGRVYHNLMLQDDRIKRVLDDYSSVFPAVKLVRALTLNQVIIASRQGGQ